jgi:anthranilate synthase/aminodeoxychorismate synthase-like glutamine amidotransferase
MIVVLNNRDSFVFNLARCLHLLGVAVRVVPAHGTAVAALERLAPEALVISPGPCTPAEAGCSLEAIRTLRGRVPMLGVCLGHQAIAAALGGRVIRADEPVHGRTSPIHHDGTDLFAGIPDPMAACRYHSLVVEDRTLPAGLAITARTPDGTVMALAHAADRLYGVQFHPESILTSHGFRLLANFLDLAGIPWQADIGALERLQGPRPAGDDADHLPPDRVVTF